ncbi:ABC transporter ATP-binding protein [Actinoplanes ianthinogenes]|uniref:ABC transporter ATP-binding protein n=1 Tax=Actinoplanes ianthinogenes TaxID=122358 RepID=A0ABM7LY85_9ACTN|nr:ATP-binding cassette domain-containing protein [Actinoplanes ianthinogenes]BCJ44274.1 ABC transporter ATP-binding protein [Actinoplanes ianthinogenes]GGQ96971.1 ABC transporter ATP-binding protein [Actinoplanes ianthinogenes]
MRFDGVWFRYARRAPWALREAAATVAPGQTVVVLGPNGAGKSTLLQLAAGVLRPVRGAVRDRPRTVGWVPERFPADQPFTALGYLRAMARLRDAPPSAADDWIDRLGLAEHTGTPLAALSKGTAQKVGLAQALLTPPGLLVLDEPWEGLDARARTLVPQIVAEVTGAGGAVLVSDHRGEIAGLPDATHWSVTAGTLQVEAAVPAASRPETDEVVVEIAVPRTAADDAVVRLRESGHRVLGVREIKDFEVRDEHPFAAREEDRR